MEKKQKSLIGLGGAQRYRASLPFLVLILMYIFPGALEQDHV